MIFKPLNTKKTKKPKYYSRIREARPSSYYIYICEHWVYSGERKNKHREDKALARGGRWRNRSRRVLAMAQWVLLISQWQCQGSWQGPDARHQLQRLVNRLLSRRHICTAMVAHTHTRTHTGIWAHAYTMAGTQTDTDLLSLPNLVKGTVNLFVRCILLKILWRRNGLDTQEKHNRN